jgi:hypothetical protein
MPITTLSVNLNPNEDLVVRTQEKSKWLIPFTPIGKHSMRNPDSIDALDVICKFNTRELYLLSEMRANLNPTYKFTIKRKDYSPTDYRRLTTAVRSFLTLGLIKRIKREQYMINPYFLVPSLDKQKDLIQEWELIP